MHPESFGNFGVFIITASIIIVARISNAASATAPYYHHRPSQRLSVADWTNYNYHELNGPGTYAFGYNIEDPATDNVQFRDEEKHANGTVTGSYGYVEPTGNVRIVHYIADHRGYRATEENSLKLSMLRPLSPFAAPESQENYRRQEIYDQRTRPFDKFNNHNGNLNSDRQNWYFQHNLINDLPINGDLYEVDKFDAYPGPRAPGFVRFPGLGDEWSDGYEVHEEPRRIYYPYK